jgi:putative sterol carrier protein
MTPADIFANVTERFDVDKAKGINMAIQFDLTGEGGGTWAVNVADGKVNVVEEAVASPTATVKMDANDYVDMSTGKLNPMMAFMSGKVKVDGDLNSVMQFQQLFGL